MNSINFFEKKSLRASKLFPQVIFKKDNTIKNVKTLNIAEKNDLTFFESIKYKDLAKKTKSNYCLTNKNLAKFLPPHTEKIIVKNVLYELAKILNKIYLKADLDYPDTTLKNPKKKIYSFVKFYLYLI